MQMSKADIGPNNLLYLKSRIQFWQSLNNFNHGTK